MATAEVAADASGAADGSTGDAAVLRGGRELPNVVTDWCLGGLPALDEETCYVLPAEERPRQLLVYLHGIVPDARESEPKERVQSAVKHAAARAKIAAIVPRGRQGIGPMTPTEWAWPTTAAAYRAHAQAMVARWTAARRTLEAHAGTRFEKVYLAGSSNGAWFITSLVFHGDLATWGFRVDGVGIFSGGSPIGRDASVLAGLAPIPIYIGFGRYDPETAKGARSLAKLINAAGWPNRVGEQPVGHGAREIYIDEALGFFAANERSR